MTTSTLSRLSGTVGISAMDSSVRWADTIILPPGQELIKIYGNYYGAYSGTISDEESQA